MAGPNDNLKVDRVLHGVQNIPANIYEEADYVLAEREPDSSHPNRRFELVKKPDLEDRTYVGDPWRFAETRPGARMVVAYLPTRGAYSRAEGGRWNVLPVTGELPDTADGWHENVEMFWENCYRESMEPYFEMAVALFEEDEDTVKVTVEEDAWHLWDKLLDVGAIVVEEDPKFKGGNRIILPPFMAGHDKDLIVAFMREIMQDRVRIIKTGEVPLSSGQDDYGMKNIVGLKSTWNVGDIDIEGEAENGFTMLSPGFGVGEGYVWFGLIGFVGFAREPESLGELFMALVVHWNRLDIAQFIRFIPGDRYEQIVDMYYCPRLKALRLEMRIKNLETDEVSPRFAIGGTIDLVAASLELFGKNSIDDLVAKIEEEDGEDDAQVAEHLLTTLDDLQPDVYDSHKVLVNSMNIHTEEGSKFESVRIISGMRERGLYNVVFKEANGKECMIALRLDEVMPGFKDEPWWFGVGAIDPELGYFDLLNHFQGGMWGGLTNWGEIHTYNCPLLAGTYQFAATDQEDRVYVGEFTITDDDVEVEFTLQEPGEGPMATVKFVDKNRVDAGKDIKVKLDPYNLTDEEMGSFSLTGGESEWQMPPGMYYLQFEANAKYDYDILNPIVEVKPGDVGGEVTVELDIVEAWTVNFEEDAGEFSGNAEIYKFYRYPNRDDIREKVKDVTLDNGSGEAKLPSGKYDLVVDGEFIKEFEIEQSDTVVEFAL